MAAYEDAGPTKEEEEAVLAPRKDCCGVVDIRGASREAFAPDPPDAVPNAYDDAPPE